MPTRPLSPHLSVYKFKYTLLSSIVNRITGVGLSMGLIALTYWLLAVASGARAQARAQQLLCTPVVKLFLAAMVICFCYHLVAGIRHLVWDTGRGLERSTSQKSAWLVGFVSVLLMLGIGYCLWQGVGAR
jgi:succinate dehydrogenase / fumarate reductase, cytochrome b subunit